MAVWQEKRLGDIINIKHGFAFKGEYISDEANGIVLVSKQENKKLNKMVKDIASNLENVSTKVLNNNERSMHKIKMAQEYLRTLMYRDEEFYKKNS